MQGFVARRLLANVKVAELVRRAVAAVPRLLPGIFLPLALLWAPAIAAAGLLVVVGDTELSGLLVLALFSGWSLMIAPALSGWIAAPVVRSAAGSRLRFAEIALPGSLAGVLAGGLAGVATSAGYAACLIPGFFLGAALFVVGAAARVERLGVVQSFRRSLELTHGNRFALFGAAFVIGFVEQLLLQFTIVLAGVEGSLLLVALTLAVCMFSSALRAAAGAIAYNDLRIAREGLEPDALAQALGGIVSGVEQAALSERQIEAFARRRGLVGKLVGQAETRPSDAEGLASVRDMESIAGRRDHRLRRLGLALSVLLGAGLLSVAAMGLFGRVQEARRFSEYEATVRAGGSTAATSREIVSYIVVTRSERRLELVGRLLAIHADDFYGRGLAEAFQQVAAGKHGDELYAALETELEKRGCSEALASARQADKHPGRAFAKQCPAGEASPIDLSRMRSSRELGLLVLAQLCELRARELELESDPLHELVVKALLGEV